MNVANSSHATHIAFSKLSYKMKNLIVLSDLHLWQATDSDDLWMRYRHRCFLPDAQIAALVALLCDTIPDGELELVLNGDIFDFDIPAVKNGHAVASPSPRSEADAIARLRDILADHTRFLTSLAKLLARRHRVIFIAGNHDLQLHFRGVQALLRERIAHALRQFLDDPQLSATLSQNLAFHLFFYRTASGVHIEHGNQYDPYCAVPDPEWPFHVDGTLHTNVGALALEHLVGKLGYFNPNVDSTFLLTTREYLEHWVRYYLGTSRSLVGTWIFGSLRVLHALWRTQGIFGSFYRCIELQTAQQAAHSALFARPELRAALRLFGVDRLLLLLSCLCAIALFFVSPLLAVAAIFATLLFHPALRPRGVSDLSSVSAQVNDAARNIAKIHDARAVIFGHTHQPHGVFESGIFYGNSGTWVPMYRDVACSIPVEESRPLIWLRHNETELTGGLYRFHEGALHAVTKPAEKADAPITNVVSISAARNTADPFRRRDNRAKGAHKSASS